MAKQTCGFEPQVCQPVKELPFSISEDGSSGEIWEEYSKK